MQLPSSIFAPAIYSGVSGSGRLTITDDGDCGAEDLLMDVMVELLKADDQLAAIFGDAGDGSRIEKLPARNPFDFSQLPRLQVYASTTTETQAPTAITIKETSLYTGVRFDVQALNSIPRGRAGMPTLRRVISNVLQSGDEMLVNAGADEVPLAHNFRPAGVTWLWDQLGDRFAGVFECQWTYGVDINYETGRIHNLAIALGG